MFVAYYYIRIAADRVRVDTDGVSPGFDDTATVAILANKIEAVGRNADSLKGTSNVTLVRPFSHPRLPVHDYVVATKLLQHATRSVMLRRRWFDIPLVSRVIIHPTNVQDGALTSVEERIFLELARELGARIAIVHIGRELTMEEVRNYDYKKANQAFQRTGLAFGAARR